MQFVKGGPRVIRILLLEIMAERNLSIQALADLCGLAPRTIANYAYNKLKHPSLEILARIAAALGVPTSSLYEEHDLVDLRSGIRQCTQTVVHKSSRTFREALQLPQSENVYENFLLEFISSWDDDAGQIACDFMNELQRRCTFARHVYDPKNAPGTPHIDIDRELRNGSCHICIASPATSSFAETVVAYLYGVPPYRPDHASVFPYVFVWPKHRRVVSAFGRDASNGECGIWSRDEGRMVAHYELLKQGNPQARAKDGGLIVVSRVPVLGRAPSGTGEGLVIALLGLSGPGTVACMQVLRDLKNALELYPPEIGKPIMRAVTCTYGRSGLGTARDDRFLDGWELLPIHGTAQPTPPSIPHNLGAPTQTVPA